MKLRQLFLFTALVIWTTGCSAGMINLDPKFQDIDNSIAQNEARIVEIENDFTFYKSSYSAIIAQMQQDILYFMPPGFVMCVISSDTAFNWEVKYGTEGVKVSEILP